MTDFLKPTQEWSDMEAEFGNLSLFEAITIATKGGPKELWDVPKGPVLDAWLKGAHVKCIDCGLEVEPETDPWGQIWTATSWVHVDREVYQVDLTSLVTLPCPRFMLRLLSNLPDGSLADVDVEP